MPIDFQAKRNELIDTGLPVSTPSSASYNIDNTSNRGDDNMKKQDYVTHDELTISELKNQRQLDRIENKIDNLSNQVSHAISEDIPQKIELALLKEREYQQQQQKDNRRFFWSTIIIGGISAIAAIGGVVATIFF